MTRRAKRLSIVLLVMVVTFAIFFSGKVRAVFQPKPAKMVAFSGKLVSYDPELKTIVIATGNKGSIKTTFAVAADVKLKIDGKPGGSIAAIKEDTHVSLKLNSEKSTVMELTAQGAAVHRQVTEIDAQKRTATILVGAISETLPIAADAQLLVAGKPAALGDLPTNIPATVRLSVDQKTIVYLNTQKPAPKKPAPIKTTPKKQ